MFTEHFKLWWKCAKTTDVSERVLWTYGFKGKITKMLFEV